MLIWRSTEVIFVDGCKAEDDVHKPRVWFASPDTLFQSIALGRAGAGTLAYTSFSDVKIKLLNQVGHRFVVLIAPWFGREDQVIELRRAQKSCPSFIFDDFGGK